jgi:hypothetical protein
MGEVSQEASRFAWGLLLFRHGSAQASGLGTFHLRPLSTPGKASLRDVLGQAQKENPPAKRFS